MTSAVHASVAAAPARSARGTGLDRAFEALCFSAATFLLVALGGLIVSLAIGGWPAFAEFGVGFFFSAEWDPVREIYGAAGAVTGTLVTATLALIFPATLRLPIPSPPHWIFVLVYLSPLIAGMIHDWKSRGRVHHVYIWGGLIILLSGPGRSAIGNTAAWQSFARFLVG